MRRGKQEGKDSLIGKLSKLSLADENSVVGAGSAGSCKASTQPQRKENKRVSSKSLSRKGSTSQTREVLTTLNASAIERLFDIAEQAVFRKKPYKEDVVKDQEISRNTITSSNKMACAANARSVGEEQGTYSKRCARESDALLLDCPESLKHVNQSFLKQVEAFDLADQCNKGLGVMPKPSLLVSKVQEVPAISKDASSPVEQSKDAKQDMEKTEDKQNEIPDHFRFCFEELDKPAPALYGRAELSTEEARAYEQAQNRYAQMIENLNKNVTHPIRKDLPLGGEQGSNAKTADKEAILTDDEILSQPRYPQAIKVFCVEHKNDRSNTFYRKFTACALSSVWETYLSKDPYHLHWYEIIRENLPCHLYFDLEYPTEKGLNTGVDGNQLVDILIENVNLLLLRNFDLSVTHDNIYELDSSSPSKFSRHLIMRLPGYAFYNNVAIGDFLVQVLDSCGKQLLIEKEDCNGKRKPDYFVDTGVYTKNRHFRIVYSCKGGKNAVLMPTNRYALATREGHHPSPAEIFLKTIVTKVESGVTLLSIRPLASMVNSKVKSASRRTVEDGPTESLKLDRNEVMPETSAVKKLRTIAHQAIPYIEKVATTRAHGKPASVRTVALCGGGGLVAYSMTGNGGHYCENVGRDHRNNYVYYVANFSRLLLAQKCHDPDCVRYRSGWMPLPEEFQWNESHI